MRSRKISLQTEPSATTFHRTARRRLLVTFAAVCCAVSVFTPARAQVGESTVVAVVDGRSITQKEVDDSVSAQLVPLQQQIHALRKAALENLIVRAVLDGEATRRGVSVEELNRQLTAGEVSVPAGEVERSYVENASAFGSMSPDEARMRLRLDMETQARMKNYREALATLPAMAQRLDLDVPRFSSCLGSDSARMAVLRDVQDAQRLGIGGTPAFLINGRLYQGALSHDALKEIVEREMRQARGVASNK